MRTIVRVLAIAAIARAQASEPEPETEPEPITDYPSPPASPSPPPLPSSPPLATTGCAPAFGTTPTTEALALPRGTLAAPRALSFNPAVLGELWVADAERSGLARIRLSAPTLAGTSTAVAEDEVMLAKDRAEYHYMPSVTSLAFDPLGQFATCQESVNVYDGNMQPNFFMGPTMYDTRERGWVSSKQEPCLEGETCFLVHVDMLHESPLCMGLVHDNAAVWTAANGQQYRNVYWAIGGGHSQLVRFDFESDHGPGSMDHSLASVRRYTGLKTTRVAGVPSHMVSCSMPSHMARLEASPIAPPACSTRSPTDLRPISAPSRLQVLDEAARLLYLADTGADRVVIVHTDTGR